MTTCRILWNFFIIAHFCKYWLISLPATEDTSGTFGNIRNLFCLILAMTSSGRRQDAGQPKTLTCALRDQGSHPLLTGRYMEFSRESLQLEGCPMSGGWVKEGSERAAGHPPDCLPAWSRASGPLPPTAEPPEVGLGPARPSPVTPLEAHTSCRRE